MIGYYIGLLVGLTCWILFAVLPLCAVIYLLVLNLVNYDDGPPMDYMLEEEDWF